MSEKNILTEEQAKNIADYLIKYGIRNIGKEANLFRKIQQSAAQLRIVDQDPKNVALYNLKILSNADCLRVVDKIWDLLIKGYVAPGKNSNNPWFPHIHLTEKGEKYFRKIKFD